MKVKVCSFNIRYDTKEDGINSFENRKTMILDKFPGYGADLIGFQEVLPHVRDWLEGNMKMYTFVGNGRSIDLTGESSLIGYNADRFTLIYLDTFWLSDTPYTPGSRFTIDQSGCPRICTCAVLRERSTGKLIRIYNTHLDHVGEMAKVQGMTQILSRIAADDTRWSDTPVVLTGDMNDIPGSPVYEQMKAFSSCGKRLVDATENVGDSFHGYRPAEASKKIDYIFTTAAFDADKSRNLVDVENGVYFSDHYPVMAEIEL